MSDQSDVVQVKVEQGVANRKKLIQKVRRKVKRENERVANAFQWVQNEPRSALGSYMGNNTNDQYDFEFNNHITMGQNRKMKKKLKKLQKKMPQDKQRVFKEMQKYKQTFYKVHEKKLFNPVNELQKRRDKRMKKMEANIKKTKAEVIHKKNLQRFQ